MTQNFEHYLNSPSPQPMLDNAVSLQFLYGIDTDNDNSINSYATADKINDWSLVKSVQLGILLKSSTELLTAKQLRQHAVLDFKITTNDRYLYRRFSLNIALRNRLPVITKIP